MIRREARRIVTSPLAWFCVVIYAAVLLMGIAETLKIKEAISDQGWLDLLCVSEEYGITTLVKNLVFPMSVASVYFDEIPQAEKDELSDVEKKLADEKTKKEAVLGEYAGGNKVIRQLIDLALLQNNMLKGEALTNFVKRSIELI